MFWAMAAVVILLLVFYLSGYSGTRGINLMLKWNYENNSVKSGCTATCIILLFGSCMYLWLSVMNLMLCPWRCWNCYVECHFNHTTWTISGCHSTHFWNWEFWNSEIDWQYHDAIQHEHVYHLNNYLSVKQTKETFHKRLFNNQPRTTISSVGCSINATEECMNSTL
jgi:hypothetical protein